MRWPATTFTVKTRRTTRGLRGRRTVWLVAFALPLPVSAQVPLVQLPPATAEASVQFTHVRAVRELSDGRLILDDMTERRLLVLDWTSTEPTPIGRIGDGPKEWRGLGPLYPLAGDSTLFVDSYYQRWKVIVDGTLEEVEGGPEQRGTRLLGADVRGNVLGVRGLSYARPETWRQGQTFYRTRSAGASGADSLALVLAGLNSPRWDTIARLRGPGPQPSRQLPNKPGYVIDGLPLASHDRAILFPDGWIAVVYVSPYRVDWRTPDGSWRRGRPLPFESVVVTDDIKCRSIEPWLPKHMDWACDPDFFTDWPRTVPPFAIERRLPELFGAPDGSVVVPRLVLDPGISRTHRYDIIDRSGELIGVLMLSPAQRLIGFGADSAFTLTTDNLGLQTLARHPWPIEGPEPGEAHPAYRRVLKSGSDTM